jgi:hypothetical protein
MLRKSLVALMLGVLCTGSAIADDTTAKKPECHKTGIQRNVCHGQAPSQREGGQQASRWR